MWQKLSKCYPPHLELIPLLLLADDWGSKNAIFIFPSLNAFIYILFTFVNIWFSITKDPRALINLPMKWKAAISDTQVETLRVMLNRYLFLLKIIIQGLTAYILYITIEMAWERADSLGSLFFLFILAILVVAGLMVWRTLQIARPRKLSSV